MAVLLAFSCASPGAIAERERSMTGTIRVIGHEPFTHLALETPGGPVYVLHCTPETEQMLLRRQGLTARVYYRELETVPTGWALRVLRAEPAAP